MYRFLKRIIAMSFVIALIACGGESGNPNPNPNNSGQSLSFDIVMDSGIEAHIVIHRADGTVIEHRPVNPEQNRMRFTNIPQNALVTALSKSIDQLWYSENLQTVYRASTTPARYVNERTYFFGFFSSIPVNISGTCPQGSDAETLIWVIPVYFTFACVEQEDGGFSFGGRLVLYDWHIQTDGNFSLSLLARPRGFANTTHYATLMDRSPEALYQGVSISANDWREDFGNTSTTFNHPALPANFDGNYSGSTTTSAWYKGRWLDLRGGSSFETLSGISSRAVESYVPISASKYQSSFSLNLIADHSDGRSWAWSRLTRPSAPPFTQTITLGSELWPLIDSLAWTGDQRPQLTYSYTGSAPKQSYASIESRDLNNNIRRFWSMTHVSADSTITFPQLPQTLNVFVPRRQNQTLAYAFVRLNDYNSFIEAQPPTTRAVSFDRAYQQSASLGTLNLEEPRHDHDNSHIWLE